MGLKRLRDPLYLEEVERARRMTPEDKLFAGAQLFDMACEITMAGIRHQHPEATEEEVRAILNERLAQQRRREEASDKRRSRRRGD
jgi:hypothetical protein